MDQREKISTYRKRFIMGSKYLGACVAVLALSKIKSQEVMRWETMGDDSNGHR